MDEPFTSEGTIPFRVPSTGDEAFTYYKTFGDVKSGQRPIIVLHGGPGNGHDYILPFCKLEKRLRRPMIFYDQIGCARSTHFRHKVNDDAFWTLDLFVAELRNLISFFKLDDAEYDVIGHSWGAILAVNFASRQPSGLRKLVLGSPSASGELMYKNLWEKLDELSSEVRPAIEKAIEKDDFTDPSYLAAQAKFMSTFLCRATPPPPEMLPSAANHRDDFTVRESLQGRSPWLYDGVLRRYSSIPYCSKITAPTLFITGEFDTSSDYVYTPFFDNIPKIRWYTISGAGHMYHIETPERQAKTFQLVESFLKD